MKRLNRIAAVLALVMGVMAVLAGAKTLLGAPPGYSIVGWLPVYNLIAGLASTALGAALIWNNHRLALPAALAILGLHSLVTLLLQTAFHPVVAIQSMAAMAMRIIVWVVIVILLLIQGKGTSFTRRPA